jgi:hypothetical protein
LIDEYEKRLEIESQKQENEICNKNPKPELKTKMKEEIRKHKEEQQILLKENRQIIIDFIISNKDSIRIEDLKIYEPVYKCYREKGNCYICNTISNIICISCSNYNNEEIWLCTNHWQEHIAEDIKFIHDIHNNYKILSYQ